MTTAKNNSIYKRWGNSILSNCLNEELEVDWLQILLKCLMNQSVRKLKFSLFFLIFLWLYPLSFIKVLCLKFNFKKIFISYLFIFWNFWHFSNELFKMQCILSQKLRLTQRTLALVTFAEPFHDTVWMEFLLTSFTCFFWQVTFRIYNIIANSALFDAT